MMYRPVVDERRLLAGASASVAPFCTEVLGWRAAVEEAVYRPVLALRAIRNSLRVFFPSGAPDELSFLLIVTLPVRLKLEVLVAG